MGTRGKIVQAQMKIEGMMMKMMVMTIDQVSELNFLGNVISEPEQDIQ
jgi:hypothetical protein